MTTATQTPGQSFLRRRGTRLALGAASVAGFTLLGAVPAVAATAADCTDPNTVDAGAGGTTADIQTLLDANTSIICLAGTFDVDSTLVFDYDLTLFGLGDAVLDGGDDTRILAGVSEASIEVENLVLQHGYADGSGGAIFAHQVTAINSAFLDNEAEDDGGAIAAEDVEVVGSVFDDNVGEFGGAIFVYDTAEVEESTFTDNEARYGGAIFGYESVSSIASTFDGNDAESGGAILGDDEVWVENSTFTDNFALYTGGAVLAGRGTILQSTFLDNTADDNGRSVFAWASEVGLRGNIFAGEGAEAHVTSNEEDVVIDLGGNVFSTTELEETDLSVDTTEGSLDAAPVEGSPESHFGVPTALIFDGATLADNGGPTETVALYAGSPAVNAVPVGEPSVTVDQRGVPRDALSDAGAYEWQGAVSPDKPALAATGSEVSGWVAGAAGVLLAAGAAVVTAGRRRRA